MVRSLWHIQNVNTSVVCRHTVSWCVSCCGTWAPSTSKDVASRKLDFQVGISAFESKSPRAAAGKNTGRSLQTGVWTERRITSQETTAADLTVEEAASNTLLSTDQLNESENDNYKLSLLYKHPVKLTVMERGAVIVPYMCCQSWPGFRLGWPLQGTFPM